MARVHRSIVQREFVTYVSCVCPWCVCTMLPFSFATSNSTELLGGYVASGRPLDDESNLYCHGSDGRDRGVLAGQGLVSVFPATFRSCASRLAIRLHARARAPWSGTRARTPAAQPSTGMRRASPSTIALLTLTRWRRGTRWRSCSAWWLRRRRRRHLRRCQRNRSRPMRQHQWWLQHNCACWRRRLRRSPWWRKHTC